MLIDPVGSGFVDHYRTHPSRVTAWDGQALVPWPEATTATGTVWFFQPGQDGDADSWEGLNGRIEDDGSATVLGVPAYVKDLNLGDRVSVVENGDASWVATGHVHDAGNDTYRFFLRDAEDESMWRPLSEEFAQRGCLVDVLTPRLVALSSGRSDSQAVADRLAFLEGQGVLVYETGRMHHKNPG